MHRFILLFALGTAIVAGVAASPAIATAPEAVTITVNGTIVGPSTVSGKFAATGAVADSGTYVETFRFAGSTVHVTKVLVGSKGTIVLTAQAVVVFTSPTTIEFHAGHWRFASGTDEYERLKGGGSPAVSASADLATGAVTGTHEGKAHYD